MAMDAKERKKLFIRIGAGVVMLLLIAFAGWWIFGPSNEVQTKQSQLGASDPMIPKEKSEDGGPVIREGKLSASPAAIQFRQDEPNTVVFTLQALGGPVRIRSALIPTADTDTLQVTNIDCPVAPAAPLEANATCTASVTWNGLRTVNSVLTIGTGDVGVNIPQAAPSPAAVTADGQPAPAPAQPADPNSLSIAISAVSTKAAAPANQQVPPPQQDAQASAPQPAQGMSPAQIARENYLAARRGAGYNVAVGPNGLQPAARSPYTSWDNIGVRGVKSSFPVDMTRVVTPDKPLTAVLTYQIDTRQTVTAVATVDRDIYGSSGRTVVIPRGTKIIGRVGGGATDRVGIAWSQLIRPDGVRFIFEGESGDAMGRGGVPGRINNRYLQRYGYSLLPTASAAALTVGLGGQSSQNFNNGGSSQTQDARAVAAQILTQPLQTISQDLFTKNSAIPVQITIPAGTRITVWSVGDLRLKPAGERDQSSEEAGRNDQQNASQQQGGRGSGNFNPYAQQGGGSQQAAQPQPQTSGQTSAQSNASRNDSQSSLQVGRVDANGNYIAPPANGATPRPVTPSNGQRAQPGQQPGTTFPSNSNPWQ